MNRYMQLNSSQDDSELLDPLLGPDPESSNTLSTDAPEPPVVNSVAPAAPNSAIPLQSTSPPAYPSFPTAYPSVAYHALPQTVAFQPSYQPQPVTNGSPQHANDKFPAYYCILAESIIGILCISGSILGIIAVVLVIVGETNKDKQSRKCAHRLGVTSIICGAICWVIIGFIIFCFFLIKRHFKNFHIFKFICNHTSCGMSRLRIAKSFSGSVWISGLQSNMKTVC